MNDVPLELLQAIDTARHTARHTAKQTARETANDAANHDDPRPSPVVIGIAGPVAVGKTTLAAALQHATNGSTRSTDGFLFSNRHLEALGILDRKGFPESYDAQSLVSFLRAVHARPSIVGLNRYSHETFDIEPDPEPFLTADVVIVEGVNALQSAYRPHLGITVYLDADEQDVIGWYTERFCALTQQARETGHGFYCRFAALSADKLTDMARAVWDAINAPNLHQHIKPTRDHADWVIRKAANHSLSVQRSPGTTKPFS